MEASGDRDRTILAMVTARAWRDPSFRQTLVQDPKSALTKEGVDIPDNVNVKVLEDTETATYVALTRDAQGADPQQIAAAIKQLLPIAEGHELRFVQSTATTRYVVIPIPPASVDVGSTAEPDLIAIAADTTVQTTNVATTEEAVSQTTAVEIGEVATTVVVAGELVVT
jgi:hypothetical protein